jgi:hypothetical protein
MRFAEVTKSKNGELLRVEAHIVPRLRKKTIRARLLGYSAGLTCCLFHESENNATSNGNLKWTNARPNPEFQAVELPCTTLSPSRTMSFYILFFIHSGCTLLPTSVFRAHLKDSVKRKKDEFGQTTRKIS